MTGPTHAMIIAGARKLRELRVWNPPDVVVVEAVWYEMEEQRERIGIIPNPGPGVTKIVSFPACNSDDPPPLPANKEHP